MANKLIDMRKVRKVITMHYFKGVPAAIVPDNLKSTVVRSSRYKPTINETFLDFADHYETTVLPARTYINQEINLW